MRKNVVPATIWGEYTLDPPPSRKVFVKDVVYLTMSPTVFLDRDPHWGIYDRQGRLVDAAAYKRYPEGRLVGQSDGVDLDQFDIGQSPSDELERFPRW